VSGDVRDVVEVFPTRDGWRWRRVSMDGEVLRLSEKPQGKQICIREARAENRGNRVIVLEREPRGWA
jgi:hypothetical protein